MARKKTDEKKVVDKSSKKKEPKKTLKQKSYEKIKVYLPLILLTSVFVALLAGIYLKNPVRAEGEYPLEVFIVTKCPYSRLFMVQSFDALQKRYGEIPVYYLIGRFNGSLYSMHGPEELKENLAGICIREKYGNEAHWQYLKCLFSGKDYESCIKPYKAAVEACFASGEAEKLAEKDIALSRLYMVQGTPAVVVVDKVDNVSVVIEGAGAAAFVSDAMGFLANYSKEKTEVLFIAPKDCPQPICGSVEELENVLRHRLGINAEVVEKAKAPEGIIIKTYPAIVIPAEALNASFSRLSRGFKIYGNYAVMEFGRVLNRPEKNGSIEVFVMSKCPYGTRAIEFLARLRKEIPAANITVYYIVSKTAGNFTSLHGPLEVMEDLRQLCVEKVASKEAYWAYLNCSAANYRDIEEKWENCLQEAGISIQEVKNCMNSSLPYEALEKSRNITATYGIAGSPTFVINGRYLLRGLQPYERLKAVFCALNPWIC